MQKPLPTPEQNGAHHGVRVGGRSRRTKRERGQRGEQQRDARRSNGKENQGKPSECIEGEGGVEDPGKCRAPQEE